MEISQPAFNLEDYCGLMDEEIILPSTEIARIRPRPRNSAFARITIEEITNRDNDWLFTERMRVWAWVLIKTRHGEIGDVRFTPSDAFDLGLAHQNRRRILRSLQRHGMITLRELGAREVYVTLLKNGADNSAKMRQFSSKMRHLSTYIPISTIFILISLICICPP